MQEEEKKIINFRATLGEKKIIQEKAKKRRQSMTQYILSKCLIGK